MYRNTLTTITSILVLTLSLAFSQVVINEIHFNPASSQGSDNYYEFLELHNPGATDIDMSGYSFTEGISHVFADGTTLAAGGYFVLAKNAEYYTGSTQWGSGSLGNSTEDIEIIANDGVDGNADGDFDDLGVDNNSDGDFDDPGVDANSDGDYDDEGDTQPDVAPVDTAPTVVDYVDYEFGDYGEVHGGADGGGGSLELIDAASDNSLAASWQVSWVVGGTPGAANSTEPDFTVMTIYNIQHTTDATGVSPHLDEQVQTTGIVTGVDRLGFNSAFVIQDGSGSWNGIYCWWGADADVMVGDEVTVRGTVAEYTAGGGDESKSMTQLVAGNIVSVNSTGNTLPAAVELDIEDVGAEEYEGVLVTTSGRVVAAVNDDSYGEWRISNNLDASDTDADTINVNDRFAVTDPAFGTIATVTGPLNQWSGSTNSGPSWRIEPASEADVEIACVNANLTISVEMLDSFGDGWNGGYYEIRGPSGSVVGTGALENGWSAVDTYCLFEAAFFIYVIADGPYMYPEEISFNVRDAFGNYLVSGGVANSGMFDYAFTVTGVNETTGCMDPTAVNYDYSAAVDDGSCYYYGDICADPIAMSGNTGVAASDADQWFSYTAAATGNMTVSSVGQTEEDTYLVLLSSCDIGYEYEVDPTTGDTLYVTEYFEDLIATNDDFNSVTGVYQSEATICVVAGETYIIGWISMYYPYEDSFGFSVEETPDITTPVDMTAFGDEVGISVNWGPIPAGCAEAAASSRSSSQRIDRIQLRTKPGATKFVYSPNKKREINHVNPNQRNQGTTGPSLTRDCPDEQSTIQMGTSGGSWASERTWEVKDSEDNLIASGSSDVLWEGCLPNGTYTVYGYDSWGDGWNGGVFVVFGGPTGLIAQIDLVPSGDTGTADFEIDINYAAVYGCTDATALNYDATATEDDGSCYYVGDVCESPFPGTGDVTGGEPGWYQFTLPAAAGILTVTIDDPYGDIMAVTSCDYDPYYPNYTGIINYAYSDVSSLIFSSDEPSTEGGTTDAYLGTTILIRVNDYGWGTTEDGISISYAEFVYGCTDPNSSNYNADANFDDGSCICGGVEALMTMNDAFGDGWNGNTYVIVDGSGNEIASGGLLSGSFGVDEVCIPGDGTYSVYVGTAPATPGSWQSEISWTLTSAETGFMIAAGGAPHTPTVGDGTFSVPLPAYTYQLYRNDVLLDGALVSAEYYDSDVISGTEYCYAVTQTEGADAPSGLSEEDCDDVYVASTPCTAVAAELDSINHMDGINGRNEWFYYVPTMEGYLTVTSDIPGQMGGDTRVVVYAGSCDSLVQIGYDDDGGTGLLTIATQVVFPGDTVWIEWTHNYSPGPSIWTLYEFPAGHQAPNNFSAWGDHEMVHLDWDYPMDAYSNAVRSVEANGNTVEENTALIAYHESEAEKIDDYREARYEDYLNGDNPRNDRTLEGTYVEILGSVLRDDGTADIYIGLQVTSATTEYIDAAKYTFPEEAMVYGAIDANGTMPGSTSQIDVCDIVVDDATNSAIFGDGSFLADTTAGSTYGCLSTTYHQHTVNVSAYTESITMTYHLADDCWQAPGEPCDDQFGEVVVPAPSDEPLCFPDDFEPNDFFESPDTWTSIPYYSWGPWTANVGICPGDVDIYVHKELAYGGWVHIEIIDFESTGEMEVTLWDLGISEYALDYVTSDYEGDTIRIDYQNYGGIDGSQGETDIVVSVEGTSGGSQFNYGMSVTIEQPEIYLYNIHNGDTDAIVEDSILGYNYTHHGLVNGTEYSYYAVTVNEDGLASDTSDHVSASPRADQLFPPANLVGEAWLESVNLSWEAPPSLTPGNVLQSAFGIEMIPFVGSGNTADGFENNYDDCSDISDSPEAVYKYSPAADITVDISTCLSGFDTKVYVYENTTATVVACNEDAGFYDYYTCGYYTSYSDSVSMTAGNDYYIVVDGWGGDAGYYNLQVFEHGDTSYTEGWDYDMVVTDPNHDPEQKALAVEEHLASLGLDHNSGSRSLTGYEVLRENSGVWDVIATPDETMYSDEGLATSTGETYSYRVNAVYHGGTSTASNEVTVEPFAPITIPVPVDLTASTNGWIVELDWDMPDVGGGDLAYSEGFDDGTLGTMTTEDLTPDGGPVWVVGTTEDATSQYWSPPDHGSYAFYNDDFHEYNYTYTDARLTSQAIDLSGFTESAIAGLSLVGDLYFTQPSGPCDGTGLYSEELELMVSADGGDWESRGLVNSTAGWDMVEIPLGLPGGASSAKVGLRYSDCGGNWGYGVAVDNFAVMVPPELDLIGYNLYKNDEMMAFLPGEGFLDVVDAEGTYTYAVTTLLTMYGESAPAGPVEVVVTAPAPAMNPPRHLSVMPDGLAAELDWDPPAGGDQWIGHDNGMIGNALGGEDAFDFQVAVRFPAQELVDFQGKQLQEIQFMGGSNVSASSYQIQVHAFSPGGTADSTTLIYQSEIIPGSELEELDWNYHELEEPLPMILGAEMWIGLRCISNGGVGTYPAVVDNGETHNGLGNMINGFGSDGWVSLQDNFGLAGNWIVRGFVSWPITNVLSNSSFEGWHPAPDGGWQNFPNDFHRMGSDGIPYGNMFVDPDGAGIYGSPDGSVLEVYDGGHALKMWGMYAGGENMWGSVYQTFTAEELGGAGAEFDISAHMMSHLHDWIGQGTNSATVFASYWEGPYGYTYMGADYSNPFDGTFAGSEWHHIGVMATIPEGATYINIGIEIFQPNNDQHGSIYLDSFVAAPYNPVMEGSVQPIASTEISRKRTGGIFRDQGRPMMLFEEYIPENSYRDAAFDFLGYKVYRDGVALDTLGMGEHWYYDVVGEDGAVEYHVSAVYEEDGTGTISEANSEMVTVDLQNAPPTAVNLIAPENETVITLTAANVSNTDLGIFWSNSSDADGEQVEYTLELCVAEYDDCLDSAMAGTNLFIPYEELYAWIADSVDADLNPALTMLNITWDVWASDEWEDVSSANGPFSLVVDAGWMLSTEEEMLPEVFALHNNYPNPFNPITNIKYDIPEVSDVRIDIYNINGQRVRTLVSREHQPGRYKIQWNATNEFGSPVASGMYIYKIHAKDFVSVKKLLLMK